MADDCDCCNSTDPCDQVNCTFYDGQMLAISQTKITSRANGSTAVNTFNCTGAQSTSRGNDPPSFEVTTTLDSDVGQNGDLFAVNMTTDTWQPASQGAITKLRFCIDMFIDNASYYTIKGGGGTTDPNIACWFVVRQNSKVYGCRIAAMRNKAIWQRQFKDNLVAADFEEFYSGERPAAAGITNTASHPDFTTSGPAITFGWAVQPDGANNRAVGVDSQTDSYWDNLCVQVTHDEVTVNPSSACKPAGCTLFASSLADFTSTILYDKITNTNGTVDVTDYSLDGNNKPCVRVIRAGLTNGTGTQCAAPSLFLFHATPINPTATCGIKSISVCIDSKVVSSVLDSGGTNSGGAIPIRLAIRQDGKTFIKQSPALPSVVGTTWTSYQLSGAYTDFDEISSTGAVPSSVNKPEFETGAPAIEVGILIGATAYVTQTHTYTSESLYDNLCVTVTPDPCRGGGNWIVNFPNFPTTAASGGLAPIGNCSFSAADAAWIQSQLEGGIVLSPKGLNGLTFDGGVANGCLWEYVSPHISANGFGYCWAGGSSIYVIVNVITLGTAVTVIAKVWSPSNPFRPACGGNSANSSYSAATFTGTVSTPCDPGPATLAYVTPSQCPWLATNLTNWVPSADTAEVEFL